MRLITGDRNGYLKCLKISVKETPNMVFRHSADTAIKNLTWNLSDSTNFCGFSTESGVVKTFDMTSEKSLFKKQLVIPENHVINGLYFTGSDMDNQTCIFAESSGTVNSVNLKTDSLEDQKQQEIYKVKKRSDDRKLLALAKKTDQQYLCLGQFLPQLFDIEKDKCIWKGKNVPNDISDLEVPLYDTDGHFLHGSDKEFIVTNGFGKVRLYDITQKSRPVLDEQVSEEIIHKITTSQ
jgi:hypothetical protein